jgi:hypothetical protein
LPGGQILKAGRLGDSHLTHSVVVQRDLPLVKHRSAQPGLTSGSENKLTQASKGTRRLKLQNGEIYFLKPDEKISDVLASYRESIGPAPTTVSDFKKKNSIALPRKFSEEPPMTKNFSYQTRNSETFEIYSPSKLPVNSDKYIEEANDKIGPLHTHYSREDQIGEFTQDYF